MYNEISTYLDARIAEINNSISGTANDWLKVSLLGEKPESGKQTSYRLLIEDIEEDETISAPAFNVTANVELSFLIPNGDATKYQSLIDSYVHTLVKHIRNNASYTYSSAWRLNVMKVGASPLNEIEDGVLNTTLTMELQVIDSVTIDTNAPSAPTLTSPADGYTSGTVDQALNWTGTADSWDVIIYHGSTTHIYQTDLVASSFTIPTDSALTDGETYTWKVRGKNAGGYGDWSSIRSFTVDDDPSAGVPVLDSPANGASGTGTELFKWSTSANADTYEIQIANDSGFTSLVTTVTGLTATYYSYTFTSSGTYYWRVRATNTLGSSAYTSGRSVVETVPLSDYRTGLVAEWLATTGITSDENGVSAWVDTISSRSATQSTASNKPYYAMNAINGKPTVKFSGASNHQWLTFSSLALTNFTIIVGYKASSFRAGDSNYFFGGSGQGLFSSINALSIGYGEFDGTRIRAVTYSASDTTWHIRTFQNSKLYSNGVEATYSNTQNMTGLTLTTIGTRGDNTSLSFKGEIAFIRVYDSVLSTTNEGIARAYLNSIWGLS
mgnify:CR=1 FL=1